MFRVFSSLVVLLTVFASERAQADPRSKARVQVIHNSPDHSASSVDIYLDGALLRDNFMFREATPFTDVPAGTEITIAVAPSDSHSAADAIADFKFTLEADKAYVVVADGVLNAAQFAANPDGRATAFNLFVKSMAREAALDGAKVEFTVFHGSPDAPTVDVLARGVGALVNDAAFGDFTDYIPVPPASYTLDIGPGATPDATVASFAADLSSLGGGSATVLASGFLDPAANQNGPAFGVIAALANGTVVTFPSAPLPPARVQVVHNAPDPGASSVDVYLDGILLLDDFAFRTATPFVDVPSGKEVTIAVAPPSSTSVADAIAKFKFTLDPNRGYIVVANGVLDPSQFAVNPDGKATAFNLFLKPMARESAQDGTKVEFTVFHGSPDAPTVDVLARGAGTLVNDAAFGDFTDYIAVPPASYTLDVTPGASPEVIVATFVADLSSLGGGSAAVLASGFLDPAANQNGPAFGLIAVLADGTVVTLPLDGKPVLDSGPIFSPDPAVVGADVAFSATASDPEGGELTYTWEFGDGNSGTGATAVHQYASPGSYNAVLTVSDGVTSTSTTFTVPVAAELTIDTLRGLTVARVTGRDRIRLLAEVSGFEPTSVFGGKTVTVNVGGVAFSFILDPRARGREGRSTLSIVERRRQGASILRVRARLKGDLSTGLGALGISASSTASQDVTVPVLISIDGVEYGATPTAAVTSKQGRFAKFRVRNR